MRELQTPYLGWCDRGDCGVGGALLAAPPRSTLARLRRYGLSVANLSAEVEIVR